jgi:hypothetical protein
MALKPIEKSLSGTLLLYIYCIYVICNIAQSLSLPS